MSGIELEPKDAISALGAIAIAFTGMLWKRISSRVSRRELKDYMEQNERNFDRLLERFDTAEKNRTTDRAEVYGALGRQMEHQANTNVDLAKAVGALEGAVGRITGNH